MNEIQDLVSGSNQDKTFIFTSSDQHVSTIVFFVF